MHFTQCMRIHSTFTMHIYGNILTIISDNICEQSILTQRYHTIKTVNIRKLMSSPIICHQLNLSDWMIRMVGG